MHVLTRLIKVGPLSLGPRYLYREEGDRDRRANLASLGYVARHPGVCGGGAHRHDAPRTGGPGAGSRCNRA
jgi:hypothetical protein